MTIRIEVHADGKEIKWGTGWVLLTTRGALVVTAAHVIGNGHDRKWRHELAALQGDKRSFQYMARVVLGGKPNADGTARRALVRLTKFGADFDHDIALLSFENAPELLDPTTGTPTGEPLHRWADLAALLDVETHKRLLKPDETVRNRPWTSIGYPRWSREGQVEVGAHGSVVVERSRMEPFRGIQLQLTNSKLNWEGLSGAAVTLDGAEPLSVLGVMKTVDPGSSGAFATPAPAIAELVDRCSSSVERPVGTGDVVALIILPRVDPLDLVRAITRVLVSHMLAVLTLFIGGGGWRTHLRQVSQRLLPNFSIAHLADFRAMPAVGRLIALTFVCAWLLPLLVDGSLGWFFAGEARPFSRHLLFSLMAALTGGLVLSATVGVASGAAGSLAAGVIGGIVTCVAWGLDLPPRPRLGYPGVAATFGVLLGTSAAVSRLLATADEPSTPRERSVLFRLVALGGALLFGLAAMLFVVTGLWLPTFIEDDVSVVRASLYAGATGSVTGAPLALAMWARVQVFTPAATRREGLGLAGWVFTSITIGAAVIGGLAVHLGFLDGRFDDHHPMTGFALGILSAFGVVTCFSGLQFVGEYFVSQRWGPALALTVTLAALAVSFAFPQLAPGMQMQKLPSLVMAAMFSAIGFAIPTVLTALANRWERRQGRPVPPPSSSSGDT